MMDFDDSRINNWKATGSMASSLQGTDGRAPHTCRNEVVGVFGYGAIGK
jgi:hypothetical protein